MASTEVLNCSHGQALSSFKHAQDVSLAEGLALREFTSSGSLKKSSFFISPKYCVKYGNFSLRVMFKEKYEVTLTHLNLLNLLGIHPMRGAKVNVYVRTW